MISSRFAIIVLLVGCGGSSPNVRASISIPKVEAARTASLDDDRGSSDGRWWTRLSIEGGDHALRIFPNAAGGVRAFVTTESKSQEEWGTTAALVDIDVTGHEIGTVSAVESERLGSRNIALGENGAIVFAGDYRGAVGIFGLKIVTPSLRSPMYLVALERDGALAWSHTFSNGCLESVARRSDGVVVVSGRLQQPFDFGGGMIGIAATVTTFVAAFDARGNHLFSRAFDLKDDFTFSHVAFASDGTIALFVDLGSHIREIPFANGAYIELEPRGTAMLRFDHRGNGLKSSILSITLKSVAVGPEDDFVVVGDSIEEDSSERSQVVVRVDEDANEVWRHALASKVDGSGSAPIAVDAHGNILTVIRSSLEGEEGLWEDVVGLDAAGKEIYKRRMQGDPQIEDIAFSRSGEAFIAGRMLGKDLVYDGEVLPARPEPGVFVIKLSSLVPK